MQFLLVLTVYWLEQLYLISPPWPQQWRAEPSTFIQTHCLCLRVCVCERRWNSGWMRSQIRSRKENVLLNCGGRPEENKGTERRRKGQKKWQNTKTRKEKCDFIFLSGWCLIYGHFKLLLFTSPGWLWKFSVYRSRFSQKRFFGIPSSFTCSIFSTLHSHYVRIWPSNHTFKYLKM